MVFLYVELRYYEYSQLHGVYMMLSLTDYSSQAMQNQQYEYLSNV